MLPRAQPATVDSAFALDKKAWEKALVGHCLAGSEAAWAELVRPYQGLLLHVVKRYQTAGIEPAAIVQDVWVSLYSNNPVGLNKFDPERGTRLSTFLKMVAMTCLKQAEARRRRHWREVQLTEAAKPLWKTIDLPVGIVLDEFRELLTESERIFFDAELLGQHAMVCAPVWTDENKWQLRSRILKKWNELWQKQIAN